MTGKRLYVVRDAYSESGGAFVAESISEAKKMALREDIAEERTQLRVQTLKNDVATWEKGIIDYKRGLREGIFGSIEDDCDRCCKYAQLGQVISASGDCICSDCEDNLSEVRR